MPLEVRRKMKKTTQDLLALTMAAGMVPMDFGYPLEPNPPKKEKPKFTEEELEYIRSQPTKSKRKKALAEVLVKYKKEEK